VPDLITRVAEVPPADDMAMMVEMARSMFPGVQLNSEAGGIPAVVAGAMVAQACHDLPKGARLLRVVVVAEAP
jgi:hypothetical protein